MNDDFHITVSDAYGGEQTILIWVPLAILAHNVVMENGGSEMVAHKASLAVIHHGKGINYDQKLNTVGRQVIISARKAADAVIEELGNGDIAAAVLEAVREGGELFAIEPTAQDPEADPAGGDNNNPSSNLIHISLSKPMGIVFEPIGDPQECGVRIRDIPRRGKGFLSGEIKAGDELLSINDTKMSNFTFYEVVNFISEEDNTKQMDLIFQRPNKREMKAALGNRFSNLIKRGLSRKGNGLAEQRDDNAPSREVTEMSSPAPIIKPIKIKRGASRKSNQLAEQRDFGAPSHEVNEMSSPTPGSAYLKTKKSDTHHMSTQSIVSDSYGSFLSEGYDSLDFFGFGLWQWQCWNPSLASRVTTNTDDDESSHALQKCDLSNLFGCSYMVANSPSAT